MPIMKRLFACVVLAAICAAVAAFGLNKESSAGGNAARPPIAERGGRAADATASRTWGNPGSLRDHFERDGRDFAAKDADDYARMAAEFLHRAKAQGLPAKVDNAGTIRVFEPRTGAFGAYNRNGTTKTFFKPGSNGYFDRQPGARVDLRTWR